MAKYSTQFLRAMTQPSYQEGLFTAARELGGLRGRLDEERRQAELERQEKEKLAKQRQYQANLLSLGASGTFDPEMLKGALGGAAELEISPVAAAQAISAGRQMAPKRTLTRSEYFSKNPNELANLYKNFKGESVDRFLAGTGPLQVLDDKEDAKKLSSHGQRLIEQGMIEDSDEFRQAMKDYNESLVSGKAKGMTYKGPLEQTQFLTDEFRKHPFYQSIVDQLSKVNLAESLAPGVEEGNSEQIRLMERTISELYNSDSRAASEIDRLLQGRGIKRDFADWVSTAVAGDVSPETKQALQEILKTSKIRLRAMQSAAVKSISDSYGDFVSEKVIKSWVEKNKDAQILETLTGDEVISIYLK
tara:strand:+ start:4591 stop:5673 length:1083 start_codon:yes stop_codon:yes gene_type:complete